MVALCFAVFVAVVAAATANPAELSLAVPAGVPPRRTPVMAWNAWNTFSINGKPLRGGRKEYETIAEAMVDSGMVAAGYTLLSSVHRPTPCTPTPVSRPSHPLARWRVQDRLHGLDRPRPDDVRAAAEPHPLAGRHEVLR